MTETKAQNLISDIVRGRVGGLWLNGEYCPIRYHVSRNRFYITFGGDTREYTRNALRELLTVEAERLERYSRLILNYANSLDVVEYQNLVRADKPTLKKRQIVTI